MAEPDDEREQRRQYQAEYRAKNHDRIRAYRAEYDAKNREQILQAKRDAEQRRRERIKKEEASKAAGRERARHWAQANPERARQKAREWAQQNPERTREIKRAYYERHKEERQHASRNRNNSRWQDPDYREKKRQYNAEHREERNAQQRAKRAEHREEHNREQNERRKRDRRLRNLGLPAARRHRTTINERRANGAAAEEFFGRPRSRQQLATLEEELAIVRSEAAPQSEERWRSLLAARIRADIERPRRIVAAVKSYLDSPDGMQLHEQVRMDSVARRLRGANAYPDLMREVHQRAFTAVLTGRASTRTVEPIARDATADDRRAGRM